MTEDCDPLRLHRRAEPNAATATAAVAVAVAVAFVLVDVVQLLTAVQPGSPEAYHRSLDYRAKSILRRLLAAAAAAVAAEYQRWRLRTHLSAEIRSYRITGRHVPTQINELSRGRMFLKLEECIDREVGPGQTWNLIGFVRRNQIKL